MERLALVGGTGLRAGRQYCMRLLGWTEEVERRAEK